MNDLTPAESEAVRRLLADARSDEQLPPEVAARLDGVIAGLAADRTAPVSPTAASSTASTVDDSPPAEATVVPLRRRRWPQVLVAAAAVTAIAMAGTQLLGDTSGQDNASPASDDNVAASTPEPVDRGASSDFGSSAGRDGVGNLAGPLDRTELGRDLGAFGVRRLVPLPVETEALLDTLLNLTRSQRSAQEYAAEDPPGRAASKTVADALACGPLYTVDGARFFAARYRGHAALVLAHPDLGGLRLVEVYDCQDASPRRSVELVTLVPGE